MNGKYLYKRKILFKRTYIKDVSNCIDLKQGKKTNKKNMHPILQQEYIELKGH